MTRPSSIVVQTSVRSRGVSAELSVDAVGPVSIPRRVFVASPLAGRGWTDQERARDADENLAYAIRCQADAIERGETPYVPHLTLTHTLDDSDPRARARGLALARAMMAGMELLAVYEDRGVSAGMLGEIAHATRLGIPVERRRVGEV